LCPRGHRFAIAFTRLARRAALALLVFAEYSISKQEVLSQEKRADGKGVFEASRTEWNCLFTRILIAKLNANGGTA
jgi:hypothetical protein